MLDESGAGRAGGTPAGAQTNCRKLSAGNLQQPYDAAAFASQLRRAGVPQPSLDALAVDTPNTGRDRLRWLYDDVASGEAWFEACERRSQVVGIFVTDGRLVLLERSTALGAVGEQFKLGGQVPRGREPRSVAVRELAEETPLHVAETELRELGRYEELTVSSPKLPGIASRKELIHYVTCVASLAGLRDYEAHTYLGSDGHEHDLLLLPLSDARTDPRVKHAYRAALARYQSTILAYARSASGE